ncbi:MAG: MFS transporter [Desulfurococcales archaeon]|nr:MFS transporter [Desulfurococcales archaeon]
MREAGRGLSLQLPRTVIKGGASRPLVVLAFSQLLFWTGYSSYYVITRRVIEERLGEDYSFGILLSGAEEAPLIASIMLGYIADRVGRKRVLTLGLLEALLVAMMAWAPLHLYPLLAGGAALAYAIAYSSLLGMVLRESYGSGLRYSVITAFGSLGWGAGGLVGGASYALAGEDGLLASAALLGIAYLAPLLLYREPIEYEPVPGPREVLKATLGLTPLVASISLSWAALTFYYGAVSIRLSAEIEGDLAYGVVLTTLPALTGFAARPIAGIVADKMGGVRLLAVVNTLYSMLVGLTLGARGVFLVLLWATPLFPFRDVAASISVSTRLPPSLQATAAGILSFASSSAGTLAAIATLYYSLSFPGAMTTSAILLLASNLALLLDRGGRRRNGRACWGG